MLTLFTTPVIYLALDKFRRGRHPNALAIVFAGLVSAIVTWLTTAAGMPLREGAAIASGAAGIVFAVVRTIAAPKASVVAPE